MIKVRPVINVITAVSRPHNLFRIEKNITESLAQFTVRWYCMYDSRFSIINGVNAIQKVVSPGGDSSGAPQKNAALDMINEGLCCFLDDDNLFHEKLGLILSKQRNFDFYIFSQIRPKKILEANPHNMKCNSIDVGQIFFHRHAVGSVKFKHKCYTSDWEWIKQFWASNPDKFLFINEPVTYYNALR